MKETWKDAYGYEDFYLISNYGNLYSKRSGKVIKPILQKSGYYSISTKLGNKSTNTISIRIHRLVAKTFVQNPENKPFVNHKDGNKLNNSVENLEWCTQKENSHHASINGLYKGLKGENGTASKLTNEQVNCIRQEHIRFKEPHSVIAKRYNVCRSSITKVLNNRTYID